VMDVLFVDEQDDPVEPEPPVDLARSVLIAEGLAPGTRVAITVVDEVSMAAHNETATGREGPTDVLAFPLEDARPESPPQPGDDGPPVDLGDVVICPAVVRANAASTGVRFEDEFALMVVHGVLHLLGYDHVEEAEAELMEARERTLLAAMGPVRP